LKVGEEKERVSPKTTTHAGVEERRHPMTISLTRRVTLRELLEQAWQQIEGQAREMLKRAVEDCWRQNGIGG